MKRNSPASGLLALTITVLLIPVASADDFTNGRLLAAQCAQCHGTDGRPVGDIESLAGVEVKDFTDKMKDMRRAGETGGIMKHQAKGLTDEQIRLMALYFSSLPKESEH